MLNEMVLCEAKTLHSMVISALLYREGIGEISESELNHLSETPLEDMLSANRVVTKYQENLGLGERSLVTEESSIAELFLRLKNPAFYTVKDVINLASNTPDIIDPNEDYGILIDGFGNSTLLQLNASGTGGKDILNEGSFNRLYNHIVKMES